MLAREYIPERTDCVLQWHKLAFVASEDLSNLKLNSSRNLVVFLANLITRYERP